MKVVNNKSFPELPVTIHINPDRCDGCGICKDVCPVEALNVINSARRPGKKLIVVDPQLCHGCGVCQATCPKEAIALPGLGPDEMREYIALAIAG
ncbi:4Fe-4S binding protein [Desulfonatronovibrio magnus]|uniref:4Fe-4S binding protein n=1 Tax=Desulfonatronovibrio magnus TaxID=698827 RepID=UPI0005EB0EF2|nr:4Fe-4S binding protein [Desulfonatronovibrio magnus]